MGSVHWEVNGTEEVAGESDAETAYGTCSDVQQSELCERESTWQLTAISGELLCSIDIVS